MEGCLKTPELWCVCGRIAWKNCVWQYALLRSDPHARMRFPAPCILRCCRDNATLTHNFPSTSIQEYGSAARGKLGLFCAAACKAHRALRQSPSRRPRGVLRGRPPTPQNDKGCYLDPIDRGNDEVGTKPESGPSPTLRATFRWPPTSPYDLHRAPIMRHWYHQIILHHFNFLSPGKTPCLASSRQTLVTTLPRRPKGRKPHLETTCIQFLRLFNLHLQLQHSTRPRRLEVVSEFEPGPKRRR
jgi:hypothetical protein